MKTSLNNRFICMLAVFALIPLHTMAQTPQDKISKFLLLKISRDQSQVLCQSEAFAECMGFDREQCLTLSEQALKQCLDPLPDTIKLSELKNESLEACPKDVYAKAGFPEEKAQMCLQKVLESGSESSK